MISDEEPCFAIQLGMNCCTVGFWINGFIQIIPNDQGFLNTPACVAFTETQIFVGDRAISQIDGNLENTVFGILNMIGKDYLDLIKENSIQKYPFELVQILSGQVEIKIFHQGKFKLFTPEELLAMLLSYLKLSAEAYFDTSVTNAVISIPTYFSNSQREATFKAGVLSGLQIKQLLNDSTAISIAYTIGKHIENEKKVIFFHLGAG